MFIIVKNFSKSRFSYMSLPNRQIFYILLRKKKHNYYFFFLNYFDSGHKIVYNVWGLNGLISNERRYHISPPYNYKVFSVGKNKINIVKARLGYF